MKKQIIGLGVVIASIAGPFVGGTVVAAAARVDQFTGGGAIDNPDLHVTLGMHLPCTATNPGAELEINWFNPQPDPPGRESFHLTSLESVSCDTNSPSPRDGGTIEGHGEGVCKTSAGLSVPAETIFTFEDRAAGDVEPNRDPDMVVELAVRGIGDTACLLDLTGRSLAEGNLKMVDDPDF